MKTSASAPRPSPATPPPAAARKRLLPRLLLSLIAVVAFFGLGELLLRWTDFKGQPRERITNHPWIAMMFRTVEEHFPTVLDPPGYFWIMPKDQVGRDASGRMFYRWPLEKPPGVIRVAFLGGSTTQPNGYRDYPRRVIKLLNDVAGTNRFEELNLGLSGYAMHESLIALERIALPRKPDVVVVYHGWNDPTVNFDGRSDRQVDADLQVQSRLPGMEALGKILGGWRMTHLLGLLVQSLDRSWPHARVDPVEFRALGLRMADLCREQKIPLVLVKRPISLALPINEFEPILLQHWGETIGSTNKSEVYSGLHRIYTAEQMAIAAQRPEIRLVDADAYLARVQRDYAAAPHDGVSIFQPDAMHMTGLGNQYLSEIIAPAIAPELADQVAAYVQSATYWRRLAEEFKEMDAPFECDFAAGKAAALNPDWAPEMAALQTWSREQFAFWRLFEEYRWGTAASHPLDVRLKQLATCLELRPHDFGVAQQIHRCAMYLQDRPAALPLLRRFQPTTPQDRYRWLQLLLDAAIAGQSWSEVRQAAAEILAMNPQDATALQVMQAFQAHP